MDLTTENKAKLAAKDQGSQAGGGFTNLRFAKKAWLSSAPLADLERHGEVFDSFIFLPGYDFVSVSAQVKEFDLNEEANEAYGSEAVTSTIDSILDGDEATLRNLVNEYNLNADDVYLLIDHCKRQQTYMFGHGLCCPAKMKIGFKSGKAIGDMRGFPAKITVEDDGLVPLYRGIGSISREFAVAADTTAIDVSTGAGTYVLPENTQTTAIAALNNAEADKVYTLKWNSTTEHSTIADGATFHLTAAFAPATGAILMLKALKADEFVEIARYIPS